MWHFHVYLSRAYSICVLLFGFRYKIQCSQCQWNDFCLFVLPFTRWFSHGNCLFVFVFWVIQDKVFFSHKWSRFFRYFHVLFSREMVLSSRFSFTLYSAILRISLKEYIRCLCYFHGDSLIQKVLWVLFQGYVTEWNGSDTAELISYICSIVWFFFSFLQFRRQSFFTVFLCHVV